MEAIQLHQGPPKSTIPFGDACKRLVEIFETMSIFKPEVAIIFELYEDEMNGVLTPVSSVGVKYGVKPTTMLRYLKQLEQRGWVVRSDYSSDRRIKFVRIAPMLRRQLDQVFNCGHTGIRSTSSTSYTPIS
jgi:DNA-binding MarR family transcriptional regulator